MVYKGLQIEWVILLLFQLTLLCKGDSSDSNEPIWTWECVAGKCQKYFSNESFGKRKGGDFHSSGNVSSLAACKVFCGDPPGSLWPLPTGTVNIEGPLLPISVKKLKLQIGSKKEVNQKAENLFKKLTKYFNEIVVQKNCAECSDDAESFTLEITGDIAFPNEISLNLKTDESYSINLKKDSNDKIIKANLISTTYFGMKHAVETLNQLIIFDDYKKGLFIPKVVQVTDKPVYPYRALTLDTSRNFISVKSIKRTLDGMAANKLNVFHWHITDTHSFPFVSPSLPLFSKYGAYSPDKVYKPEDIKDIVEYARIRGIKVIPEFDAPAHVGEGWQWTPPGTIVCLNEQPWIDYCVEPPCGQLDPTKDHLYDSILNKLYKDMIDIFEIDHVFHMGGDEVHFQCWNKTTAITDWMRSKGWDVDHDGFLKLWNYFQERAYNLVEKSFDGKKTPDIILWTSGLTTGPALEKYLDNKKYIIQIWTTGVDPNVEELLKKGYRVIFSNYDALYLDCGFGGWVAAGNNWCSPYKSWQTIYMNDPLQLVPNTTDEMRNQILGQSAALWTEQADDETVDNRFWPRASAMAERTWTNPITSWDFAEYRMLEQRERLVKLGLAAEALEPMWCNQNEGSCPIIAH